MVTDIETLPEKIKKFPHWRVHFHPNRYEIKMNEDPVEAFNLLKQTFVSLGGWNYPYIPRESNKHIMEEKYIAYGCDWDDIIEYWRLYYSGQFIHLFATWERDDKELNRHTREWVLKGEEVDDPPGIINISNVLYTFTKIFEFATRLCEKRLYTEKLAISVRLENIRNYVLTANWPVFWHGYFPARANSIKKEWNLEVPELLSNSNELSLEGMIHFYKYFGWNDPSIDVLLEQQTDFLSKTQKR